MPIGKVIEELRRSRSLTQLAVADYLGTTQRELSFIENGKRGLKPKVFHKLMECLNSKQPISPSEWTKIFTSMILDSLTSILSSMGEGPTINFQEEPNQSYGNILIQLLDDRLFMVEMLAIPKNADPQLTKQSAKILNLILSLHPKNREIIAKLLSAMSTE